MTLAKLLNFSGPKVSSSKENSSNTYLIGLWSGFNDLMHRKHVEQCRPPVSTVHPWVLTQGQASGTRPKS